MADSYTELLDATIRHLEELKARGTTFVSVAPGTLDGLKRSPNPTAVSPAAPTQTARPAAPAPMPVTAPAKPAALASPLSPPASASSIDKIAAMQALRERVLGCSKCSHLSSTRKNVVFGVGNLETKLMFVGEAPGADEDRRGEPFVGAAGQLLTKIIAAMGLRREDVYIANVLKCRPDMPQGASGNRKPTTEEMATCVAHLQEQIDIIKPGVIVGLGATALEGLLGNSGGITRVRGKWQSYRGIPVMPTYHPAYLLYNSSNTEKRKLWEDMLLVMEKLGMPISEKQRGYFL